MTAAKRIGCHYSRLAQSGRRFYLLRSRSAPRPVRFRAAPLPSRLRRSRRVRIAVADQQRPGDRQHAGAPAPTRAGERALHGRLHHIRLVGTPRAAIAEWASPLGRAPQAAGVGDGRFSRVIAHYRAVAAGVAQHRTADRAGAGLPKLPLLSGRAAHAQCHAHHAPALRSRRPADDGHRNHEA